MAEQPRPVAVVTGAARGIGAAVAEALARDGWDLVLGDVPRPDAVPGLDYPLAGAEELADVAERCGAAGAAVATAACDVRDEEAVQHLVARAGAGRLRAAVAVAGVMGADGPAWEQSAADLDRDLAVDLHGVAHLARAAVPRLLATGEPALGRFVAVVSAGGVRGLPRLASYVAAKHGALGYVRALATDLAPHGVTANAVLPGSTRTRLLERTARAYGLGSVEEFAAQQRLGRLVEPAEVAETVRWLCSPVSSATTGAALPVDAGFTG
ncbi:SDR family oxidoreductase [Geodermatophilus marinus]|uniref:SDR family oxidoreductase n=1 Tax=Geodermatophilus sp. LHW52908 TaxID=2303986 RepID=UPI000E3ECF67|nr:SDR family oxidoreductase [Geodermatophilus sp. LHW52908]RFU22954.1 SDR family oxidoreductase [Geodermatophilus sp. LHW52908]